LRRRQTGVDWHRPSRVDGIIASAADLAAAVIVLEQTPAVISETMQTLDIQLAAMPESLAGEAEMVFADEVAAIEVYEPTAESARLDLDSIQTDYGDAVTRADDVMAQGQTTLDDARALANCEDQGTAPPDVAGDFDALYDQMHPDARAFIPREVIVGWFGDYYADKDTAEITVTGVEFVSWTWPVTGVTYPNTAEVSFIQPVWTDGMYSEVVEVVRLVQGPGGEWHWFFGRSQEFVEDQIEKYSPAGTRGFSLARY